MAFLRVSTPARQSQFSLDTRLVYRVVLDSGEQITLPELAKRLKLPYSAIAGPIHKELSRVGEHTDRFLKILAAARTKTHKMNTCPHCKGTGTVQAHATDSPFRAIRECVKCGYQHKSKAEFDTCSTCRAEEHEAMLKDPAVLAEFESIIAAAEDKSHDPS